MTARRREVRIECTSVYPGCGAVLYILGAGAAITRPFEAEIFEGGADFSVSEFAASDHEEPEGNPVRRRWGWGHHTQARELANESGLQALGPAIVDSLQEGPAVAVSHTLPQRLRA